MASVAWHSRIMPIRFTDATGFAYASTIVNGLTWAADHGAKVMNISIGGVAGSSAIASAAQYVRSRGGVVVASAGNCGCFDATPPNPYIISVSATDQTDSVTSWSSRGNYVDIAAPGYYIYTTARGGGYQYTIGTSFSSPIVAGVVALMMAVNPSLSPADLENLLKAKADDKSTTGWDPAFGYGRVNAYRAVAAAAGAAAPAPAPTADTTPPVVAISGPANGATVAGTITVAAVASDNVGVARVEFYLDGTLFTTATGLIATLGKAFGENRLDERLKLLTQPQVLIIDEIGYIPIDRHGANLFFQLVSRRYERGAIILTSNQSLGAWGDVFGDPVIATAVLDRLLHHSITVNIRGESYRLREKLKAGLLKPNLETAAGAAAEPTP